MLLQLFVYVLIPLSLVFYLWSKKKLNSLQQKSILCMEPSFPLGNMNGVGKKIHLVERQQEIYEAFKKRDKIAGFYSLLKPTLMILDLDLLKNIMIKDFNNFTDRDVYYNEDSDPVSAHMFALNGAEWKFIRNKLSPTFTTGKIKAMFGTVVDISEELVKVIDSGKEFETRDLCNRFICDVIGSVAFGLDCQALKNENCELLEAGNRIFRMSGADMARFFFCNSFMGLSKSLNLRLLNADCTNFFIKTVREAVKYREDNNIQRPDFLNSLIQLKNTGTIDGEKIDNDKKLTFNQIISQAFLFYFAGFETSSTTMSFMLYELAANPDIQARARNEIKKTLEKYDGKFTYDSISEMIYLNQVFNESLRKYSTVGTIIRAAKDDYKVPDSEHVIPAGTQLWVPVFAIHRDEEIYPNPNKFDPERFTPEEISKRHNFAFIPFGEGPRNCIGMRFAQLQTKYGVAKLLLEYELSLNSKMELPAMLKKDSMSMEIEGGIWIDFKKLN